MSFKKLAAILAAFAALSGPAAAATFHTSQASWDAKTDSETAVVLPPTGSVTSFTAGDLTFSRTGGSSNLIVGTRADWSSVIAGDDLAVSGPEDVLIDFASAVTGFAFLLHEPTVNNGPSNLTDSCNATCVDTEFVFRLFLGGSQIASFNFNPADNIANFVGFTHRGGFDRLVIDDA